MTQCSVAACERPTVLPADYQPLCSRHYLRAVDAAEQAAAVRFQAHVAALWASRGEGRE